MRVAVLGLGRMGSPIAERLLAAGHDLSVWNRTEAAADALVGRGAHPLVHPADAFARADVVITMLADGPAVEAVTLDQHGLLAAARDSDSGEQGPLTAEDGDPGRPGPRAARDSDPGEPGPVTPRGRRTLIDMSTISAATSARLAAACEPSGVAFLRAPVTGNPSVVVAGNLGIIVSGPKAEFDRLAAMLREIGPNLFYVEPGDEARIVKLALNLMIAGTAQLMAEALVLAETHGIGRAQMLEVMGGSAIGSPFVKYKTDALVADDYRSTFTSTLMHKDLALALEAAQEGAAGDPTSGRDRAEVQLALTALTQQLVGDCVARGMGDLDFMALLPRLRLEAGL